MNPFDEYQKALEAPRPRPRNFPDLVRRVWRCFFPLCPISYVTAASSEKGPVVVYRHCTRGQGHIGRCRFVDEALPDQGMPKGGQVL